MPYVDFAYYRDVYKGVSVLEADFPKLEARASEIIDELTFYRVAQSNIENYSTFIQTQFKKAICTQVEYIDGMGGVDALNEQAAQSMSLGKFNYSSGGTSITAPNAIRHLFITGLMYRGIDRL